MAADKAFCSWKMLVLLFLFAGAVPCAMCATGSAALASKAMIFQDAHGNLHINSNQTVYINGNNIMELVNLLEDKMSTILSKCTISETEVPTGTPTPPPTSGVTEKLSLSPTPAPTDWWKPELWTWSRSSASCTDQCRALGKECDQAELNRMRGWGKALVLYSHLGLTCSNAGDFPSSEPDDLSQYSFWTGPGVDNPTFNVNTNACHFQQYGNQTQSCDLPTCCTRYTRLCPCA